MEVIPKVLNTFSFLHLKLLCLFSLNNLPFALQQLFVLLFVSLFSKNKFISCASKMRDIVSEGSEKSLKSLESRG